VGGHVDDGIVAGDSFAELRLVEEIDAHRTSACSLQCLTLRRRAPDRRHRMTSLQEEGHDPTADHACCASDKHLHGSPSSLPCIFMQCAESFI
jgi:hypothetical protein